MPSSEPQVELFEEKINYIKMLIREGDAARAMQLLEEIEHHHEADMVLLPPSMRYLIPYSRGKAYIAMRKSALARLELETALTIAEPNTEAEARTRNLLGALHYVGEQPEQALSHHLACIRIMASLPIRDGNFRLSVYQNLANAYWALNDMPHAIGAYKEALRILKDVNAPQKQADLYWGLALAYKSLERWRYSRLYASRAIQIYRSSGKRADEAVMSINMAEILLEEGRIEEVAPWLDRAAELLADTFDPAVNSYLYRYRADLERRRGRPDEAWVFAETSLCYAREFLEVGQSTGSAFWMDPHRTYVEALHGAALVKEAQGDFAEADRLFEMAFEQLSKITVLEIKRTVHLSYASLLEARGDFKGAATHYKAASAPGTIAPETLLQ